MMMLFMKMLMGFVCEKSEEYDILSDDEGNNSSGNENSENNSEVSERGE